jgi:predicted phosphodiesterase
MRIALISDIHGNLVALDAVLADIKREGADQIVCLGDVALLGPQPREVIARLRELGCPGIMGNHDHELLNMDELHDDPDAMPWLVDAADWCFSQLSQNDLAFLGSFVPHLEISLDDTTNMLCFHGTPDSPNGVILATTPSDELDSIFEGYSATVMVGGHMHIQMLRQHKGTPVVNVGSVGMPLEEMPFEETIVYLPWAEYAIISWANEVLNVDLRRVSVDFDAMIQAGKDCEYPWMANEWVKFWRSPDGRV